MISEIIICCQEKVVSAGEFDGTLRKQGYPADTQPVVHLQGNVHDIIVSVPPWIAAKLNTRAETGQ